MTISEMQDKLENLQNDLLITSETATAVEASLSEGILSSDNAMWALVGIIRSVDKAAKDAGVLVDGMIGARDILAKL